MSPHSKLQVPAGYQFGTASAHIKYPNRKDVGFIVSNNPAACAAVFTQNRFCAAPVIFSREMLENSAGIISGVVVNSGCANAATGEQGMQNAATMAHVASESIGHGGAFLVCSTGTIGVQLPMEKLEPGIVAAAEARGEDARDFIDFADSIMTTDTVRKVASATLDIDGKTVTIAGCAKGSGMIYPNMATLLAFVITDADIEAHALQELFQRVNDRTLNCITVDGDTSTNDTAIILANGAAQASVAPGSDAFVAFERALTDVMTSLARQLARDGEGASHLVQITVKGAASFAEARTAAMAVANSPLVKTAIYGKDANWGRIACALGNSGVAFDAAMTDISLGDLTMMRDGVPLVFSEERALEILGEEEIHITADLKAGDGTATVWTCDFTEKYVEINGAYRT